MTRKPLVRFYTSHDSFERGQKIAERYNVTVHQLGAIVFATLADLREELFWEALGAIPRKYKDRDRLMPISAKGKRGPRPVDPFVRALAGAIGPDRPGERQPEPPADQAAGSGSQ